MRVDSFLGMAPGLSPVHLPAGCAVEAINCYIGKGDALTPERAPAWMPDEVFNPDGTAFVGEPRTIWRSGDVWVAWDHWVHVCPDPRKWSSEHAYLYVDDGVLWRSSDVWMVEKSGPRKVGITNPGQFPTVQVMGSGTKTWQVDPGGITPNSPNCPATCDGNASQPGEARAYVYTCVNNQEEESAPSDPSEVVVVPPETSVMVSASATPPEGTVKWRWYRTLPGDKDPPWKFVAETTSPVLSDIYDPIQLGDELDTESHFAPPPDLRGITSFGPAGILVWNAEGDAWPCFDRLPNAFAPASRVRVPYPIITARSACRLVEQPTTTDAPGASYTAYILTGKHPYVCQHVPSEVGLHCDIHEVEVDEPVVAPWAATPAEGGVVYSSSRGLMWLSSEGVRGITDESMTRAAWTRLQPHEYTLAYNQGRVFGFRRNSGWVMVWSSYARDRKDTFSLLSTGATAVRAAPDTHRSPGLVLARGQIGAPASLLRWEGSTAYLTATWQSRQWQNGEYWNPGALKVDMDLPLIASSGAETAWLKCKEWLNLHGACGVAGFWKQYPEYLKYKDYIDYKLDPVVVEVFREGRLQARKKVFSRQPVRLPRQGKGIYWHIRIHTRRPVYRVIIAKSICDLAHETEARDAG